MVLVSAMHITAAVYVNDWEDGLIDDFQEWLEKLAPAGRPYRHHQTGEDNADAHLKRTLMGHQVIRADHRRQARPRAVGAGVLRGVRRPAAQARDCESHGRMMTPADPLDLRARPLSRGQPVGSRCALRRLYHPACDVTEHVFLDDATRVSRGRDAVSGAWAREFIAVVGRAGWRLTACEVASRRRHGERGGAGSAPTGDCSCALPAPPAAPREVFGHSHFWIEDGLIVRHRSVVDAHASRDVRDVRAGRLAERFRSRPVVGDRRRGVRRRRPRRARQAAVRAAGGAVEPAGRRARGRRDARGRRRARDARRNRPRGRRPGRSSTCSTASSLDERRTRALSLRARRLSCARSIGGTLAAGGDVERRRPGRALPRSSRIGLVGKARDVIARAVTMRARAAIDGHPAPPYGAGPRRRGGAPRH